MRALGSSPRVWGQVAVFICPVSFSGIIPTRVGTSSHNGSIGRSSKDHPHACGDKPILTEKNTRLAGSSPRVWGQANWSDQRLREIRIIPTRVGTRLTASATTSADKDHPHACGDKCDLWNADTVYQIIPTRVGTSHSRFLSLQLRKDHPHACGDKSGRGTPSAYS